MSALHPLPVLREMLATRRALRENRPFSPSTRIHEQQRVQRRGYQPIQKNANSRISRGTPVHGNTPTGFSRMGSRSDTAGRKRARKRAGGKRACTMSSNYPPGHPTGVSYGTETQVFSCDPCNRLWTPEDYDALKLRLQLKHHQQPKCPSCGKPLELALCGRCEEPATHIDVDLAVNAAEAFCSKHGM